MNLLAMMMMAFACGGFASCGDNDDDLEDTNKKSNVDPEGTVVVNMRNDGNKKNRNDYISIPQGKATNYNGGTDDISTLIRINVSNNFEFYSDNGKIVSIGAVSGLGKVNTIPSNGWANSAAVVPGCGYIVKFEGLYYPNTIRYARLYVVEYMTSATTDGIIGATVKYQGNWKSADTN